MKFSRSIFAKFGAIAVALIAFGGASLAHAGVSFAVGANIAPGVSMSATNAPYPVYAPPVAYVAPAPVYYAAPVYAAPAPAPIYVAPAPVVYGAAPVVVAGVQYYWSPVHHRYYYFQHGARHWR
jgi:hypothetical protein